MSYMFINDEKTHRDFYLTAPEAAAYGVVDSVLQPSQVMIYFNFKVTN